MRMGRRVKDRQEPLKWVKQRAVTIQKRRAQELAKQEGGEDVQQGLYAEWQTELYRPPPIKDVGRTQFERPRVADEQGVIPTNAFGNIDLYAPTMLPVGAVHLPCAFPHRRWACQLIPQTRALLKSPSSLESALPRLVYVYLTQRI